MLPDGAEPLDPSSHEPRYTGGGKVVENEDDSEGNAARKYALCAPDVNTTGLARLAVNAVCNAANGVGPTPRMRCMPMAGRRRPTISYRPDSALGEALVGFPTMPMRRGSCRSPE